MLRRTSWLVSAVGLLLTAGVVSPTGTAAAAVAPPGNWYKVDLHEHSTFSGDARADPGVDAAVAMQAGYNAVMLTDHDRGANFQIQGANGNYLSYSDSLSGRWMQKTTGSPTSSVNAVDTTTVHSGTSSLHLKLGASSSTTQARTFVYAKRGPILLGGGVTLDFWVFPQQIDAKAGVDVSVSLGGDATTQSGIHGYTANGTPAPQKSTVLVWELGKARPAATGVYVNDLQYQQGAWNHYTVDVRSGATTWTVGSTTQQLTGTGIDGLAVGDRPADYDVLSQVKMEASGSAAATADAFFDDYVLRNLSPRCPAADIVYRNSLIDAGNFNGTNAAGQPFQMFPAREMGQNNHSNQFNFDIQAPSAYSDTYSETTVPAGYGDDNTLCSSTNSTSAPWKFSYYGTDNIPSVQASGYPAQNNHPGVTDTTADVTASQAYGADLLEVLGASDYSSTWDTVLQQNHVVIGTYGSDAHEGVSSTAPATNVYAPSLTLDALMRSLFEGRVYLARGSFTGRLALSLDGSTAPYPARYPVYVPAGTPSAGVTLDISGGLSSGQTIRWVTSSGGTPTVTTAAFSGSTYHGSYTVPLSGSFTYVRAEVRDSSGGLIANTEPIFFESVANMAATSLHVDSVSTTAGCSCSVAVNKGITSLAASSTGTVTGQMTNPAGATVGLLGSSAGAPTAVTMDGTAVTASTSLAAFQAATGDAWFYDPGSKGLYLQDQQSGATSSFAITFPGGAADSPPSAPANLQATPGTNAGTVALTWSASTDTDGTGVAGYRVYRDGTTPPAEVGNVTSYVDSGLASGSSHTYTVTAVDTAGNESAPSAAATTTASTGASTGTLTAAADAYVDSSQTTKNTGTATTLRTDTSPVINSYVRFSPRGFSTTPTQATLSVYANSSLAAGFQVCTAADTWTESTLTASNAPAPDCTKAVTAKPATAGTRLSVDVTGLMTPVNTNVTFVLVGQSTTALSMGSRESANPPQLTLATSGSGSVDSAPSTPTGLTATTGSAAGAVNLEWSASTDTDTTPVAGYRVYRDGGGTKIAEVTGGATSYTDTVTPGSTHSYTVSAFDTANLESVKTAAVSGTAGASTVTDGPPSVPGGVQATTGAAAGEIDVNWSASTDTDGTGVAGYRIYRNGGTTKIADVPAGTLTYTDTGLTAGGTYSYAVSAYDTVGNESAPSPSSSATAGSAATGGTSATVTAVADAYVDGSAPDRNTGTSTTLRTDTSPVINSYLRFTPQGLGGTLTTATLSVFANSNLSAGAMVCTAADTWTEATLTSATAPAPDCSKGVIVKPAVSGALLSADVTTLMASPNGSVTFVLVGQSTTALSLGSRESANPPQLKLTTSGGSSTPPPDTPPTVPANVSAATGAASGAIDLTWSASSDDHGVGGYRVYRDGATTPTATVTTGTSYTDTGLTGGSTHSYTVSAYDTANQDSGQSAPSSAVAGGSSTPPPDTPPTVPANVSAATGAASGAIDLSWSASSDDHGVVGYRVYRDGATTPAATVTTGTSYTDTGLTAGSTHSYTVSAYDTANQDSGQSAPSSAVAGGAPVGGSAMFVPTADATVSGTTNAGTATTLRVDSSPTTNSYLKFSLTGLTGSVSSAVLSLYANSNLAAGFKVCTVADNTWTETGVTSTNAPAPVCPATDVIAKPAVAGSRVTVDVTSLLTSATGDVTFVLVPLSTTALSLGSRESTNPPQLTVTTAG